MLLASPVQVLLQVPGAVPGAAPGLLMVVGKGSTNAFVDFKSAAIREKLDFRGREWVVSREL